MAIAQLKFGEPRILLLSVKGSSFVLNPIMQPLNQPYERLVFFDPELGGGVTWCPVIQVAMIQSEYQRAKEVL